MKSYQYGIAIAILAAAFGMSVTRAQIVEKPVAPIKTEGGLVAGKVLDSGVKAWLGIPFVKPPVRELRWKEPQPNNWKGVYNADRKMPECIQILRPHNINHYFGEEATSEDCLYMNVWAPSTAKPGAKLPVIVFIYGGGNTVGSSGSALYDGEQVAKRGAIFVNFNYRLGILGFMAHPELTKESGHNASGNWAYLDQLAALKWIQKNIAQFGGDPDKVIISGQSAGAWSVSLLQASPLAKGLFRGVVGMSGGTWGGNILPTATREEAEKVGLRVQEELKVASMAELRDVPADRLLALQSEFQLGSTGGGPIRTGASIDGYFLPDTPEKLFESHRNSDVPVIAGFANDESNHPLRQAKTMAEYRAITEKSFGSRAEEFLQLYPVSSDVQIAEVSKTAAREGGMMRIARSWAIAQAKWNQSPTYIYNLVHVHPFNAAELSVDRVDQVGAYHTSDVPFWFGTQDAFNLFRPMRLWTAYDRELSQKMTAVMIAFAKTGNPQTADVRWPAWSPNIEQMIEITVNGMTPIAMNKARLDFMSQSTTNPLSPISPRAVPGQPRD